MSDTNNQTETPGVEPAMYPSAESVDALDELADDDRPLPVSVDHAVRYFANMSAENRAEIVAEQSAMSEGGESR
jgi:hypothetical protein